MHAQGWAPATSSNYSMRVPHRPDRLFISRSGVDKQYFREIDLIETDLQGRPVADPEIKTSAETALHALLYRLYPSSNCVLHTHTVTNTVLSMRAENAVVLTGYEMLKGLEGVSTHAHREIVPVFDNSQDIPSLAEEVGHYLTLHPHTHAFLLRGHGMYTWAGSVAAAKRQTEVLEFLFACALRLDF